MTAIGPASLGAKYFMEVIKEGEINLYKFYEGEIFSHGLAKEEIYKEVEENSRLLIQKGDDKVREVININIAEYIYGNLKSKETDSGVVDFVKQI